MSVGPIKDLKKIRTVRLHLKDKGIVPHTLFVVGINIALRCGDLLKLTWEVVLDSDLKKFKEFEIVEEKTGKKRRIILNKPAEQALLELKSSLEEFNPSEPIFLSRQHKDNAARGKTKAMSRQQAFRLLRDAGVACGVNHKLGTHSLRKTWAYHSWKNGFSPALIMEALNHSSWKQTRIYASIDQDEINDLYKNMTLS